MKVRYYCLIIILSGCMKNEHADKSFDFYQETTATEEDVLKAIQQDPDTHMHSGELSLEEVRKRVRERNKKR